MAIFDDELARLKDRILRMGSMVEDSVKLSVQALVERDNALAIRVIDNDHALNALDVEIDEECIRLIALMQPKGADLRLITMAMKITTDLERMGDLSVNIAERALELNEEQLLKPYIDVPRMSQVAQGMTRDALNAFVQKDRQLARDVIQRDDEVDELKHLVLHELAAYMINDPSTITRAMKISFVAQYLERIADHATNIAEMVLYLIDGKIIRHMAPPEIEKEQ